MLGIRRFEWTSRQLVSRSCLVSMDQHMHRPLQSCQFLLVPVLCYTRLHPRATDALSMYISSIIRAILCLCAYEKCSTHLLHIYRFDIVHPVDWPRARRDTCREWTVLVRLRTRVIDCFRIQVGFLLVVQLRSIRKNQSGIESWILRKARDRTHRRPAEFIYPYDLGFKENFRHVFNWTATFNVIGDGLTWPVRAGADEYALTREQLAQKSEKRQRTVRYEVVRSFQGSFVTLRYGLRTGICIPCSDEPRISIEKGDFVLVTRWERYWLYGERITAGEINSQGEGDGKGPRRGYRRSRGWFPRCCVYEAFRIEDFWSGKIDADSDVFRAQMANFGPEAFDENEEEKRPSTEEDAPTETNVTAADEPLTTAPKARKRKVRQET